MPFIRHTRDKRGYDTTYVMHAYRPQHGPQRTRVLYLFRSPSHAKVGRRPLDDEAREALEHTHPDVSFDWTVLGRDAIPPRPDPYREYREQREQQRERSPRPSRSSPSASVQPPPMQVVLDDESLLGRTVGAERAARIRASYADLLQKIARRSRTPEDRDRLTARAERLNPDGWSDEAQVRAALVSVEADATAVLEELPARRRGRRGGKRRPEAAEGEPDVRGSDANGVGSSVIIDDASDIQEGADDVEVGGDDWDPAGGGDDRGGPADAGESVKRLSSGE
ncbi:MAG: hypothetical protein ABI051_15760 [Vicinamibacterales bacterium]